MPKRQGSLTAEDFGGAESRREQRIPLSKALEFLPCRAPKEWKFKTAELTDCSTGGIGLIVDEPLTIGEQFLVKLKARKFSLLLYTVRNCNETQDRRHYRVGAEFAGIAASPYDGDREPILQALLAAT